MKEDLRQISDEEKQRYFAFGATNDAGLPRQKGMTTKKKKKKKINKMMNIQEGITIEEKQLIDQIKAPATMVTDAGSDGLSILGARRAKLNNILP